MDYVQLLQLRLLLQNQGKREYGFLLVRKLLQKQGCNLRTEINSFENSLQ